MSSQETDNDEEDISSLIVVNTKSEEKKEDADENNIVPSNQLVLETANDLESELAKFRHEWKEELKQDTKQTQQDETVKTTGEVYKSKNIAQYHQFPVRKKLEPKLSESNEDSDLEYNQPQSNEQKAQYLFNKGVLLEQQGRHFEAIKFYRMSMQLDADIEFKIASQRPTIKPSTKSKEEIELSEENKEEIVINKKTNEEDEEASLYEQFQLMTLCDNRFCEKNTPQKATHFSQLPIEVIMLILKWVVSDHLDMRSLDSFAAVCKGFYVCGRDPELWKLACSKIWGAENIINYLSIYNDDYRNMFIKRPRLNFDGVYISKTSYARAGEQSLDNFYRPWHLVEYFRYLRFFSDGNVLFLTTPDEPKSTVAKLKSKAITSNTNAPYTNFIQTEHNILKGTWTLAMNKVSIVLCKKIVKPKTVNKYSRRQINAKDTNQVDQDQIFRIEMDLCGNSNTILNWTNYEVQIINKITNTKSSSKFDLNKVDFPSLYYSRVKSYSLFSDGQLK